MLAQAYVVRLRNAATPAIARSAVSAIIAHSGSVGTAAATMVGSLAAGPVVPPPLPLSTPAVFVTVPLTFGRTVNAIGGADPPAAMTLEVIQVAVSLGSGFGPTGTRREHDQAVPVADTNANVRSLNSSSTVICPLVAVPPTLETTIV